MPSSEVFSKYKAGKLRSGSKSGPPVKSHAQAVAIFLSEKRKEGQHGGKYPEKQVGGGVGPPFMPGTGMGMPPPSPMGTGMGMPPQMGMPPPGLGAPPMGMPPQAMGGMGRSYAFGGSPTSAGLTPGWIERQEARNISHTGPIISGVGGRTDHHNISVPSGSYIMPADAVSHLGQGNTLNGMQILQGMFGKPMALRHGAGPPRPPAMMKFPTTPGLPRSTSSGGSRGDHHVGKPVPIAAAGGEYSISPESILSKYGDLDVGHRVLDRWVLNLRKKHIAKLKSLPPPAKS